jgi:hypothetical protein
LGTPGTLAIRILRDIDPLRPVNRMRIR